MERLIDAAHPIDALLRHRWSPRAFSDRPVPPAVLQSLLEAARWAPSSFNGQPWNYIVATKDDPAEFERMLACLVEKNQEWAKHAPVLMMSVARLNFEHNKKPNHHAFHDVGAASANLTFEATVRGLYVHQMAGFSPDKARETYAIPADAEPVAAIAVGYLGDPASLPEPVRQRELTPSTRKPIADFVFAGRWGETASWAES